MHPALRSSLLVLVIVALLGSVGCETHDRRIYTTRRDKNLHTPSPWSPSTTKAADEATAPAVSPSGPADMGASPGPMPAQ
jgi:hypothetical protein